MKSPSDLAILILNWLNSSYNCGNRSKSLYLKILSRLPLVTDLTTPFAIDSETPWALIASIIFGSVLAIAVAITAGVFCCRQSHQHFHRERACYPPFTWHQAPTGTPFFTYGSAVAQPVLPQVDPSFGYGFPKPQPLIEDRQWNNRQQQFPHQTQPQLQRALNNFQAIGFEPQIAVTNRTGMRRNAQNLLRNSAAVSRYGTPLSASHLY